MMSDEIFTIILAVTSFLTIISYVQILSFNYHIGMLQRTLVYAWPQLKSFSLVFFLTFLAFVHAFYLHLSRSVTGFKNVWTTSTTLISLLANNVQMKGDFSLDNNPTLTDILLNVFIFMEKWIVLLVFLAIMNMSFKAVRSMKHSGKHQSELIDFLKSRWRHVLPCYRNKTKAHESK